MEREALLDDTMQAVDYMQDPKSAEKDERTELDVMLHAAGEQFRNKAFSCASSVSKEDGSTAERDDAIRVTSPDKRAITPIRRRTDF